jgi:hypothetical protein
MARSRLNGQKKLLYLIVIRPIQGGLLQHNRIAVRVK